MVKIYSYLLTYTVSESKYSYRGGQSKQDWKESNDGYTFGDAYYPKEVSVDVVYGKYTAKLAGPSEIPDAQDILKKAVLDRLINHAVQVAKECQLAMKVFEEGKVE